MRNQQGLNGTGCASVVRMAHGTRPSSRVAAWHIENRVQGPVLALSLSDDGCLLSCSFLVVSENASLGCVSIHSKVCFKHCPCSAASLINWVATITAQCPPKMRRTENSALFNFISSISRAPSCGWETSSFDPSLTDSELDVIPHLADRFDTFNFSAFASNRNRSR